MLVYLFLYLKDQTDLIQLAHGVRGAGVTKNLTPPVP